MRQTHWVTAALNLDITQFSHVTTLKRRWSEHSNGHVAPGLPSQESAPGTEPQTAKQRIFYGFTSFCTAVRTQTSLYCSVIPSRWLGAARHPRKRTRHYWQKWVPEEFSVKCEWNMSDNHKEMGSKEIKPAWFVFESVQVNIYLLQQPEGMLITPGPNYNKGCVWKSMCTLQTHRTREPDLLTTPTGYCLCQMSTTSSV